MQLNERELGAVLAGLRLLEAWYEQSDTGDFPMLFDILTNCQSHGPLWSGQIGPLCERLNTAPDPPGWAFDIVMQLAEQNLAPEWDTDLLAERRLQEEAVDLVRDYLHQNKIWR